MKHPERHHWRVGGAAYFLMKFDREFVVELLAKHGKVLADFSNK